MKILFTCLFYLFCLNLAEPPHSDSYAFISFSGIPKIYFFSYCLPSLLHLFISFFFLFISSLYFKFLEHNLALFQLTHAKTFILLFKPYVYIFVLQSEKLFLSLFVFFLGVCSYLILHFLVFYRFSLSLLGH